MRTKYVIAVFALLSAANLYFFQYNEQPSESFSLKNISALQSSAGEATCNPTTPVSCEFEHHGFTIRGIGYPLVID